MSPGGYSNGTELFDASIQITDTILQTTVMGYMLREQKL